MVSCDSVPAPFTILVSWFSPKQAKAAILPVSTPGLPDAHMQEGEEDIRAPLAFTLPGGEAQEDGASRVSDSEPWRLENQGVGAGKPCHLAHSLGPGFGLSSPTFHDGLRHHWTLLTTLGKACLGLQLKPHQP